MIPKLEIFEYQHLENRFVSSIEFALRAGIFAKFRLEWMNFPYLISEIIEVFIGSNLKYSR